MSHFLTSSYMVVVLALALAILGVYTLKIHHRLRRLLWSLNNYADQQIVKLIGNGTITKVSYDGFPPGSSGGCTLEGVDWRFSNLHENQIGFEIQGQIPGEVWEIWHDINLAECPLEDFFSRAADEIARLDLHRDEFHILRETGPSGEFKLTIERRSAKAKAA